MNRFIKISVMGLLVLTGVFFINHYSNLELSANSNVIPVYTYKVINTYPHNQSAFTEGLVFEDGVLYEGTGLHGYFTLRRVKLETGEILQICELPPQFTKFQKIF